MFHFLIDGLKQRLWVKQEHSFMKALIIIDGFFHNEGTSGNYSAVICCIHLNHLIKLEQTKQSYFAFQINPFATLMT